MREFFVRIRHALEALSRPRPPLRLVQRQPGEDDGALQLADGDIVVVRCIAEPSDELRTILERQFATAFPRDVRVVVLGPGIDFDVLTSETIMAREVA
ncbi:hypothetical protein WK72_19040 [Burkholderia ubonensis]|uniref:hypothetical protein n=1 Tax=Burkholderia ubonensis TaxID=101571 RepID=UPI00075D9E6E|nr:hypothetical protein [Burkholderia ubonensis]KVO88526.1 hypothetical protein WJ80_07730 [Burkholderia ubonensis]KVP60797.1 hypothetical protein WJ91_06305 [Burkholderia ubonensis]KVU27552.1 hypothetical protein WK64_24925 [Burkholderia ubonensis]KVU65311.1 hypothetical protein WK72_19040 [Burkholderia ubonensis]KWH16357.1 hypothetical protein WL97_14495 [Burkholderia ubonensis]